MTTPGSVAAVSGSGLEVEDLVVEYSVPGGRVRAVDGVSLTLAPGEIRAVVGESGCGKTSLAKAVLGLERPAAGQIRIGGAAVDGVSRGMAERVGMVWQDPYASLNPRWKIGRSILEPGRLTGRPVELDRVLDEVGLDRSHADRYPHQLSGGQRQRAAIARALALRPRLVICDEPTAALDLSIRAQILNLLKAIREHTGCAILYISHDLTTVRFLADRVAVMYLGQFVEEGPTEDVFDDPRHPYSRALMDSAPSLESLRRLPDALVGEIPDPRAQHRGCRFAGRCPRVQPVCRERPPGLKVEGKRGYRCEFPMTLSDTR
ncbi:MAG: ABC transporter ATP-binding protein [Fimbriimonadaceae bacterium]